MAEHKTPYATIAKLTRGERWLLGLLGVEITVSCTRTKDSGYIILSTDNSFNDGKGMDNVESFSVKFSHEGTTQDNMAWDRIRLGTGAYCWCDSDYGEYSSSQTSKIKTDVVDKIETYRKPPFAPPMRGGIYFYMHSQKKDDNTIPKTFYRKATLLSFTTTDGVVHSIDNLNY
jgi:hypothetical protein